MSKTPKDLGISTLCKFKNNLLDFIEQLNNDLILFSVESKIFLKETIYLNNKLYDTILDFFLTWQANFDIEDYCDFDEPAIQYRSYSKYIELKYYMIYINKMIESKQIKINSVIYKQLKEILSRIHKGEVTSYRNHYEHSKNEVKSLKDLKNILSEIKEIKITY
jgi:hypothetical protein